MPNMAEAEKLQSAAKQYELRPNQALAIKAGRLTLHYVMERRSMAVTGFYTPPEELAALPLQLQEAMRRTYSRPRYTAYSIVPNDSVRVGRTKGLEVFREYSSDPYASGADVPLQEVLMQDNALSREHYVVGVTGRTEVFVADVGSTNGTWVEKIDNWFAHIGR